MSLTWKDGTATVGFVVATVLTIAIMAGFGESIDARWAYGSALLFIILAFTAMLTGAASLMERAWTSTSTYILGGLAVLFTAVNIFLNSEILFGMLAVVITLLWVEFVSVDWFSSRPPTHHTPTSGVSL